MQQEPEQSSTEMPDQRIGVEGDSFQKSDQEQAADQFIDGLSLPQGVRDELNQLTPARYIGNAQQTAEQFLSNLTGN